MFRKFPRCRGIIHRFWFERARGYPQSQKNFLGTTNSLFLLNQRSNIHQDQQLTVGSGNCEWSGCKPCALCNGAAALAIKHAAGCIMQAERLLQVPNHKAQSFIIVHPNAS